MRVIEELYLPLQMLDTIVFVFLQLVVVTLLVVTIAQWVRARRRFRRPSGDPQAIAHWRYPVEEWQGFCEAEAARIRGRDLPRAMKQFAGVAAFFMALMFYWYDPKVHVMGDLRVWGSALMAGIGVVIAAIFLWRAWHYLRLRELEYEVFVRRDGLHELFRKHGELHSERSLVFGPDFDLTGASVEKQDGFSYLALRLKGHRGAEGTKRIPVPRGREPQAEQVAQALRPSA
jgi:hypothetical protein